MEKHIFFFILYVVCKTYAALWKEKFIFFQLQKKATEKKPPDHLSFHSCLNVLRIAIAICRVAAKYTVTAARQHDDCPLQPFVIWWTKDASNERQFIPFFSSYKICQMYICVRVCVHGTATANKIPHQFPSSSVFFHFSWFFSPCLSPPSIYIKSSMFCGFRMKSEKRVGGFLFFLPSPLFYIGKQTQTIFILCTGLDVCRFSLHSRLIRRFTLASIVVILIFACQHECVQC